MKTQTNAVAGDNNNDNLKTYKQFKNLNQTYKLIHL